jgi:phage repressor protein C with HTH and peptisase S24 domain
MEPAIKSGSILFGTRVEDWQSHLEYGQIYGIVCTDKRKYLKYIRKDKENPKANFLLRSENQEYDDFELPKTKIKSIWLIHGWINKRN